MQNDFKNDFKNTLTLCVRQGGTWSDLSRSMRMAVWMYGIDQNAPSPCAVLNLRTTTSQKCAAVPRRARI